MTHIITIDGPSGAGKGTLMHALADHLGWHRLDSGVLYRLLAYAAKQRGVAWDDTLALAELALNMAICFDAEEILLDNQNVASEIRAVEYSEGGSKVAAHPEIRAALLDKQREFAKDPGLVADGRDMGTVVFPQAALKIFLTASAKERADRRFNQLKEKGIDVSLADLLTSIEARDARDIQRTIAPLIPAEDAWQIDTTSLTADELLAQVIEKVVRVIHL